MFREFLGGSGFVEEHEFQVESCGGSRVGEWLHVQELESRVRGGVVHIAHRRRLKARTLGGPTLSWGGVFYGTG